jgi:histidinol phosphatase-like enzyme
MVYLMSEEEFGVPGWYVGLEDFVRTLAIDLDGTLHDYTGWNDGHMNGPKEGAVEAWHKLQKAGYRLVIFTCRQDLDTVHAWMQEHFGCDAEITNMKPIAHCYIDDRSIRFTNWEDIIKYFC